MGHLGKLSLNTTLASLIQRKEVVCNIWFIVSLTQKRGISNEGEITAV